MPQEIGKGIGLQVLVFIGFYVEMALLRVSQV